jgi:predicted O-methyltransferase YrrM
MMKVYSWQVDALWLYLRMVMSSQLHGLAAEARASLKRVLEKQPDETELKALKKIVSIRSRLHNSRQEIDLKDYGAGSGRMPKRRTVGFIHQSSAVPHWWGVFLFRLIRELRPVRVLELGSNLGVSAAYIQSALILNGNTGRFVTIEGDPMLVSIARETLDLIGEGDRDVVLGRFQDVLPGVLERSSPLDLVFIDGHHEYQPTLEYFDQIKPFLSENGVTVFDDVYPWSRPVRKAWNQIIKTHPQAQPVDLAKFGMLFRQ